MKRRIQIAVNGAKGRMGARILALMEQSRDLACAGAFDQGTPPLTAKALKSADVLIDFSGPQGTQIALNTALDAGVGLVIGTTGLGSDLEKKIKSASKKIAIVRSSNMSIGVNVVLHLLEAAAEKLGKDFKITISETHHVHKKDAPSGTAKMMASSIESAGGVLNKPIESIREGEVVGDHTVLFSGAAETIEITHKAQSRDVFALGSLEAARFLFKKSKGLFTMRDVLNV